VPPTNTRLAGRLRNKIQGIESGRQGRRYSTINAKAIMPSAPCGL